MNEKIRILTIYSVFVLIISCKNYASGKDSQQNVKAYLDKELMQGDDPNNSLFNPPPTLSSIPHDSMPILKATQSGGQQEQKEDKEKEEIEKKIKELKSKIDKSDKKTTSLKTYSEYEEEIKKIREELEEKLKGKKEEKEKLKKELKELEDSLKNKKDERKKALEEAKQEFQKLKSKVNSTTGVTDGHKAQNQRGVGQQAWTKAKEFGLNVNASSGVVTDTSDMSSGIIDDALKQIEEELENTGEDKK